MESQQMVNQSVKWHGKDALQFTLTGFNQGFEEVKTSSLEVVMKRFQEKLLIVITDGLKFGNVVTASWAKIENEEMDMMGLDMDDNLAGEDEDGLEYNSGLLLGDKGLQDLLELFAKSLLKQLIEIPIFKDIKSIVVTFQLPELRKLDKKSQFKLMKTLEMQTIQFCFLK